jgi:tetratricopeptide (TPR) repeat protein
MSRRRLQPQVAKPVVARPAPKPRPTNVVLAPVPLYLHAVALASIAALAGGLYAVSVNGPFVYDDPNAITQSVLIRSLTPLKRFVTLSTRPLTDFSFALNYATGAYAPWPYHLTNILLHLANGLLVYGIGWATFSSSALARRYGAARFALAWAAAALFVAHPLASESVAYVSSRSEVLAGFFILLSLGSYLLAATTSNATWRTSAAIVLPLATAAGVGSKEIAATIPFALLLYDWLFLSTLSWWRMRQRLWLLGLALLPLVVGGTFLVLRAYFSPSPMGDYGATAGLSFDRFTRWQYLMTQFGVILYYFRLVVLPVGQTFDYDWPLARAPFAPGVLLPLLLLIALVYLAVRAARTQPLFTFAIGWTLLILAPTSSIMPIADLAVERRMYLPLAGLMLLAAAWLRDLLQWLPEVWRRRPERTYGAIVAVLLLASSALTYHRAELWGDPVALHEDGTDKAPDNPRVRLNLGVTYLNLGEPDKAYDTLLIAKQLYDRQESINAFARIGAFIHYNLGAVLFARKDIDGAEPQLRRSLELGGQYLALRPMAYMLLSRIEAERDNWTKAASDMEEAVKYQDNPDWRVDLAQMYRQSGNIPGARVTLLNLLKAHPGNPRATALLAQIDKERAAKAKAK